MGHIELRDREAVVLEARQDLFPKFRRDRIQPAVDLQKVDDRVAGDLKGFRVGVGQGVDMTAGSLGQGFSCAVGIAMGSKIKKDNATIYTVIGDGESQEGQIWEAAMLAASRKLDNLIGFTDYNGMQLDGDVEDINSLGNLKSKWKAFGWYTQEIDGHDCEAISAAIDRAKAKKGQPSMIILKTVKGKGISFVEAAGFKCHSMPMNKETVEAALAELQ